MDFPHGIDEIRARYGNLMIAHDHTYGGNKIISPIGWESANMILLRGLPGLPQRKLFVNKQMVGPLLSALTKWQATCPTYKILSIGCFSPRYKARNNKQLSLHTWGLAVDINAVTNPMRRYEPGEKLITDMPWQFVEAFEQAGFTWGGRWMPVSDPMHFQWGVAGY